MFSSKMASGSSARWCCGSVGLLARYSSRLTRKMLSAPKHTPLGVPVVPEVKVNLAVPSGIRFGPLKVRRQNSPSL
ncbi:hypothetical protein D3C73_1146510 [compost metagenome]